MPNIFPRKIRLFLSPEACGASDGCLHVCLFVCSNCKRLGHSHRYVWYVCVNDVSMRAQTYEYRHIPYRHIHESPP